MCSTRDLYSVFHLDNEQVCGIEGDGLQQAYLCQS